MPGSSNASKVDRRYAIAERAMVDGGPSLRQALRPGEGPLSPLELEDLRPPETLASYDNADLTAYQPPNPDNGSDIKMKAGPPQELRPIRWTAYGQDFEIDPATQAIQVTRPGEAARTLDMYGSNSDEYQRAVNAFYSNSPANTAEMSAILGFEPQ